MTDKETKAPPTDQTFEAELLRSIAGSFGATYEQMTADYTAQLRAEALRIWRQKTQLIAP